LSQAVHKLVDVPCKQEVTKVVGDQAQEEQQQPMVTYCPTDLLKLQKFSK